MTPALDKAALSRLLQAIEEARRLIKSGWGGVAGYWQNEEKVVPTINELAEWASLVPGLVARVEELESQVAHLAALCQIEGCRMPGLLEERDELQNCLDGRDDFIVKHGLWSDFVAACERGQADSRIAKLTAALVQCRMSHYSSDDSWYSCPKSEEGCANDGAGTDCTCSADAHNARIDTALKGGPK